jgi:hypothetical protein
MFYGNLSLVFRIFYKSYLGFLALYGGRPYKI